MFQPLCIPADGIRGVMHLHFTATVVAGVDGAIAPMAGSPITGVAAGTHGVSTEVSAVDTAQDSMMVMLGVITMDLTTRGVFMEIIMVVGVDIPMIIGTDVAGMHPILLSEEPIITAEEPDPEDQLVHPEFAMHRMVADSSHLVQPADLQQREADQVV